MQGVLGLFKYPTLIPFFWFSWLWAPIFTDKPKQPASAADWDENEFVYADVDQEDSEDEEEEDFEDM